jgi:hypothetical protein
MIQLFGDDRQNKTDPFWPLLRPSLPLLRTIVDQKDYFIKNPSAPLFQPYPAENVEASNPFGDLIRLCAAYYLAP